MAKKSSDTADKAKKKKKKPIKIKINWKKLAGVIVVSFIGIIYYAGTRPITIIGSQFFGVCRTYIELNVPFPSELRFIDLRERKKKNGILIGVEYMTYDSYGQHMSNKGECFFKQDDKKQIYLEYYKLKRGSSSRKWFFAIEDPEKVASFNKSVGFLRNTEINLLVRGPARSLGSLSPAQ